MTADLRRLAEQAHREPWDYWDMASWDYGGGDQAGMMRPAPFTEPENAAYIAAANPKAILDLLDERDNLAWNHEILHEANTAYERRVAALEEGLRDLWECWDTGQDDDVLDVHFQAARALLTAAPSKPHVHYDVGWDRCEHDPAALPAPSEPSHE